MNKIITCYSPLYLQFLEDGVAMSYIPENSHFIENLFPFYRLFIMVGNQFSENANCTHCPSLFLKKVDCLLINQAELRTAQQLRETPSPHILIGGERNHLHRYRYRVCIVIFNKGVNHNGQL